MEVCLHSKLLRNLAFVAGITRCHYWVWGSLIEYVIDSVQIAVQAVRRLIANQEERHGDVRGKANSILYVKVLQ